MKRRKFFVLLVSPVVALFVPKLPKGLVAIDIETPMWICYPDSISGGNFLVQAEAARRMNELLNIGGD